MSFPETPSPKRARVGTESAVKVAVQAAVVFGPDAEEELFGSACESSEREDEEDEEEVARRRWTPNQIRTRIRKLLATTDIKVTEFIKMLRVNSNTYNRFMNNKYKDMWSAAENGTYDAAARFFIKEEKLGKQGIGKQRASSKSGGGGETLPDLTGIETDGMTYLTPGETRKEMAKILKTYKTSVAALARIAGVPGQSMNKFYTARGDFGASENQGYRPAADLVEKIRMARNGAKSKKRLALEAEVVAGRTDRDGQPFLGVDDDARFWCPMGTRPVSARDELGRKIVKIQ